MLRHLHIRNLAIIDELALDLAPGFTVLTGETGAGKSILIDAVGLVLGVRADSALVRAGTAQAEVTAEFNLSSGDAALQWLGDQALSDEDDPQRCVIRRAVQAEGRTRAFVNDRPVSLAALRELGELLIEIFGQGESQTLMRAEVQRELLDAYGEARAYRQALEATASAALEYQCIDTAIKRILETSQRDPAQLDFLRYQLSELEALALARGEPEQLEIEHKQLDNADRLLQDGGNVRDALYGDDNGLYDQLATVTATLEALATLHADFGSVAELTGSAQGHLREAADHLGHLLDRLDLDPERLNEVEQRMAAIHELARKHRLRAAELPERRDSLVSELALLEGSAGALAQLQQQAAQAREQYDQAAAALSAQRKTAASKLSAEVSTRVRELGMANAVFEIAVERSTTEHPSVHGDDRVRFDFSANPGQPPRPLNKVASGGELSRISLALQVTARRAAVVSTMIFDEVDAGIGGGVAEIVGTQLHALGESRQVLCVTHLAQVAAQGQQHLYIRKEVKNNQTYTRLQYLDPRGRITELARMAGGRTVTRATEAHARELLGKKNR